MDTDTVAGSRDTEVLVIGAAGYAGRHVAAEFVRAGYWVGALQRPGGKPVPAEYRRVPGDLADPSSLVAAAKGFDLVVHVGRIEGDLERAGAEALLSTGVPLIHTSGSDVLGPGYVTEDSGANPPPIVGWRAPVERCVLEGGGRLVRPGMIYGDGGGVVADMLVPMAARLGAGVYVGEPGVQWAAVHVEDLARLYVAVAQKAAPGTAWNGCAETVTVDELALAVGGGKAICWPTDRQAPEEIRELTPLFLMSQDVSSAKTRRELGWTPVHTSIVEYLSRERS
jgi:nucleoside-diphosphate-sugar epimerase